MERVHPGGDAPLPRERVHPPRRPSALRGRARRSLGRVRSGRRARERAGDGALLHCPEAARGWTDFGRGQRIRRAAHVTAAKSPKDEQWALVTNLASRRLAADRAYDASSLHWAPFKAPSADQSPLARGRSPAQHRSPRIPTATGRAGGERAGEERAIRRKRDVAKRVRDCTSRAKRAFICLHQIGSGEVLSLTILL